jgi:hypothetical protein
MMTRSALILSLSLLLVQACEAQTPSVSEALEETALALGTIRGVQRRMDSINTLQFSGNGTYNVPGHNGEWTSYELRDATVGINYFIPAIRMDMTLIGPDGNEERLVQVARGDRAWDERLPGVDPTDVSDQEVQQRAQQIWLTPHGVITAAVQNPDNVAIETESGQTIMTVEIDGMPVTARLDENARPAVVEMMVEHPVLGETLLSAEYTDYIDWPILDVYFPSQIVHRLGGEVVLEMTVSDFYQNPYVIFPTPELLSRSLQ